MLALSKNTTQNRSVCKLGLFVNIIRDFVRGYIAFRRIGTTITVYGSARFKSDHPYYQLAVTLGERLAKEGIAVMTGGGPGIMEAVNKGAFEVGGQSYGCGIDIPRETPNPFVNKQVHFSYFFSRKYMLEQFSCGFIILPGGFGTLDELFQIVTLIKTKKISECPVILLGSTYWKPLIDYMSNTLIKEKTIEPVELDCLYLTDSIDDAIHYIHHHIQEI